MNRKGLFWYGRHLGIEVKELPALTTDGIGFDQRDSSASDHRGNHRVQHLQDSNGTRDREANDSSDKDFGVRLRDHART